MQADAVWKCEGQPPPAGDTEPPTEFSPWECTAVPWFDDPAALDRPLTDGGPASWSPRRQLDSAHGGRSARSPRSKVSNIRTTESSVAFDVSRTGVPVMVKTSYFPNWQAEGADGPWRATPNFMVVVPTSQHVRLTFATTTAEWVGRVADRRRVRRARRSRVVGDSPPGRPDDVCRRGGPEDGVRRRAVGFPSRSRR